MNMYMKLSLILIITLNYLLICVYLSQTNSTESITPKLLNFSTFLNIPETDVSRKDFHDFTISNSSVIDHTEKMQRCWEKIKEKTRNNKVDSRGPHYWMTRKPNEPHDIMSPCFTPDGKNLWGYIHIWKSGGTSVKQNCYDRRRSCVLHGKAIMGPMLIKNEFSQHHEMQMVPNTNCSRPGKFPRGICEMDNALKRYRIEVECGRNLGARFFTFVRDPIDHFFSGMEECEVRKDILKNDLNTTIPSNHSVSWWVHLDDSVGCRRHSNPQVWFLKSNIEYLDFVGDLRNNGMENFFVKHRLPWDNSLIERRHFPEKEKFKGLRNQITDDVLIQICDYVAIDYCFIDYDPPEICKGNIERFCND